MTATPNATNAKVSDGAGAKTSTRKMDSQISTECVAQGESTIRCAVVLECAEFQEHKDWKKKHPTGPVTWDAWCSLCGFRLEDKQWASGLAIEGEGRRLAHVVSVAVIRGEVFKSTKRKIVCSKCCPVILEHHDD
jgi:hypothetical protein